jgi:uncharacterized protein YecT (DUF1311 family)
MEGTVAKLIATKIFFIGLLLIIAGCCRYVNKKEIAPTDYPRYSPLLDAPEYIKIDELEKRINDIESECMSKIKTDTDVISCKIKNQMYWDRSMNDIYSQLMEQLPENAKQSLEASQSEWNIYKNSYFNYLDIFYSSLDNIWVTSNINYKTATIKNRTIELKHNLTLYKYIHKLNR